MKQNVLIGKIISFCLAYNILDDESTPISELTVIIGKMLEEAYFVESLINTIIIKVRTCNNIDVDRLKNLLIELEKARLELEYKDYSLM